MSTKLLYNRNLDTFTPYETVRPDGGPIVGLSSHFEVFDLEIKPPPSYDIDTQYLEPYEIVNIDERRVTRGSLVKDYPVAVAEPDFQLFLNLILTSTVYQSIVAQSAQSPAVGTGLTVTMGALLLAAGGSPNIGGLQAGMDLLFSVTKYTPEDAAEIQSILDQCHLSGLVLLPVKP
jgi:hypothetical protein